MSFMTVNAASKSIQSGYGVALSEKSCRWQFPCFNNGKFSLDDSSGECRPKGLDSEYWEAVVTANTAITDRELRNLMYVLRELKRIGKHSVVGK